MVVVCLWAHLCSVTHLLPSITAAIAWVDGQHNISMRLDEDGSRVVLSHDEASGRKSARHAHGVLSRFLVAFAESPGAEADHLVDFSQTQVSARRSSLQRSGLGEVDVPPSRSPVFSPPVESTRNLLTAASSRSISFPAPSVTVAWTVVILI